MYQFSHIAAFYSHRVEQLEDSTFEDRDYDGYQTAWLIMGRYYTAAHYPEPAFVDFNDPRKMKHYSSDYDYNN